jgi:hypothetical protein
VHLPVNAAVRRLPGWVRSTRAICTERLRTPAVTAGAVPLGAAPVVLKMRLVVVGFGFGVRDLEVAVEFDFNYFRGVRRQDIN